MYLTKLTSILVTTSLFILLPTSLAHADDNWSNRVSIIFGNKKLDTDAFGEKTHSAFGVGFDIKQKDWPVSVAVDFIGAGKETKKSNVTSERVTGGLHIGIRKHWSINHVEPYIGGGVNLAVAESTQVFGHSVKKQDNSNLGSWLSTGVNWKFDKIRVGLEVRFSEAEVELFNSNVQTGGVYSMATIGYQF